MSNIKTWQDRYGEYPVFHDQELKDSLMQAEVGDLRAALSKAEKERDAALAKLAALAEQEPITARYRWDNGQSKSAWQYCLDSEKDVRAWAKDICAKDVQVLYTAAGAAPVPNSQPMLDALREVHAWLVCAPIATNDDMAESFEYMEKLIYATVLAAAPKEPS